MSRWEKAAERLSTSPGIDGDDLPVYRCIKLSVDYLKHKADKEYFRTCCLFPEDFNIEKEELARYGMGLGWFGEANSMKDTRDKADDVSKRLISSGLLLDGDKKGYVKMHDVIRDVAIRMMSLDPPESARLESAEPEPFYMVEAGKALRNWPEREDYSSFDAISVMHNEIRSLPDPLNSPNLKVFLLQRNYNLGDIPGDFFKNMTSLRVLSLSFTGASSAPRSIDSLSNLRALFLDGNFTKDVSVVGSLKKLEILSLKRCTVEALPEDMGELTKLRILDLTYCRYIDSIPRGLIPRLTSLEELFMHGSFSKWDDSKGANACLEELRDLPHLSIVEVDIKDYKCKRSDLSSVDPRLSGFQFYIYKSSWPFGIGIDLPGTRKLLLNVSTDELPSWFVNVVSSRTESLMFYECHNLNLPEEQDWGQLSGLKYLQVNNCSSSSPLMNYADGSRSEPVFENLEEFRIKSSGTEICVGELPEGSLKRLKVLNVECCHYYVRSLVPSNLVARLTSLERLRVSEVSVEEVFDFEGIKEDGSYFLEALEKVKLYELYGLTSLCRGSTAFVRFNRLRRVMVSGCNELRGLFTEAVARALAKLEDLWIGRCRKMEEIIIKERQEMGAENNIITLPALKKLSLMWLENLSNFYVGPLKCPSLERVYVKDCSNFPNTKWSDLCNSNTVVNGEEHVKALLLDKV